MSHLQQIIDGGYCIGCGICTYLSNGEIPTVLTEYGMYQAVCRDALEPEVSEQLLKVCPFSNLGLNEDDIGQKRYQSSTTLHDSRLGFYSGLFIGHVSEGNFREIGTSGGLITWLLSELFALDLIDFAVHVRRSESDDDILFRYAVSRSIEDVKQGAKSRYYPIQLSEVLETIKRTSGRFAVVGLPCFIKGLNRLMEVDPLIKERVVFSIGLVCGHLKSTAFGECLAWQCGIAPRELSDIDFRLKLPDRPASHYGVKVSGAEKTIVKPVRDLLGANWGMNLFRYPACDYCDDVFAETADLTVGDAWLPEFEADPDGTSIVVVRNDALYSVLNHGMRSGRLSLVESDPETISRSQAGGLRDRREGLFVRLKERRKQGKWVPTKRIHLLPKEISSRRRRIYLNRMDLGAISHIAWKKALGDGAYDVFVRSIHQPIREYFRLNYSWGRRFKYICKSAFQKCLWR